MSLRGHLGVLCSCLENRDGVAMALGLGFLSGSYSPFLGAKMLIVDLNKFSLFWVDD